MEASYYSEKLYTLAAQVLDIARAQGLTIGTAESLTGGLIAGALTAVPGSSDTFAGGIVSYAYSVKERVLGVSHETLQNLGAVEPAVAKQMALGAYESLGCDVTVSVTGIAGPGGEEPGKPVGTVWMGLCYKGQCHTKKFLFAGSRDSVRNQTVQAALCALKDEIS